jgi:hypothetical protein
MASELPEIQIPPRTIDEVLRELDHIVDYALEAGSRLGYFAAFE